MQTGAWSWVMLTDLIKINKNNVQLKTMATQGMRKEQGNKETTGRYGRNQRGGTENEFHVYWGG